MTMEEIHSIQPVFELQSPQPSAVLTLSGVTVVVYKTAEDMGRASAIRLAREQCRLVEEQGETSFIIMAAPSAFAFYRAYVQLAEMSPQLQRACSRTHYFQFDDYPLPAHHPASFRYLLLKHFFIPLAPYCDPGRVHLFDADDDDPDMAARRYQELLLTHGLDLQIMGIGENGHWGFHEPGIPLDGPPQFMKVALTTENVDQQMRDHPHIFKKPDDVPKSAYTCSVSMFLTTRHVIEGNVPQASKAFALLAAFGSDIIHESVPASALKRFGKGVVRTTEAAAWALLEYRNRGGVTRDALNKLAESLRGPQSSDISAIISRISSIFDTMKIAYER
ncbi:6-phosphogluconolactonase [Thermogutta sp.]|uniref:6-phosphogluconolactonase n=1 Tax=Thermogutta sp. TaxID=1962930 RepID=UPI003C7D34BE